MRISKAFTLIELLVVISIIGLLSSVVLASLNAARVKARDTARLRALHELSLAINLYMQDNDGKVPPDTCAADRSDSGSGGTCTVPSVGDWHALSGLRALVPTYISALPKDPVNSGTYGYQYEPSAPNNSCLWARLEKNNQYVGVVFGPPLANAETSGFTMPGGYQCDLNGGMVN